MYHPEQRISRPFAKKTFSILLLGKEAMFLVSKEATSIVATKENAMVLTEEMCQHP